MRVMYNTSSCGITASSPVTNAGDGGHMHPTQTTADLTTMTRLLGGVDGLAVGPCGDLKNGRPVLTRGGR